jgi:hypothetical protein
MNKSLGLLLALSFSCEAQNRARGSVWRASLDHDVSGRSGIEVRYT